VKAIEICQLLTVEKTTSNVCRLIKSFDLPQSSQFTIVNRNYGVSVRHANTGADTGIRSWTVGWMNMTRGVGYRSLYFFALRS
jgi:hypothetical protein